LRFIAPLTLFTALTLAALAAPALAQPVALHPEAGHAVSDLRAARDILSHGAVSPDDQQAIDLIDKVIFATERLKHADEVGLGIQEQYGADASPSSRGRLENAHIMLAAAAHDLNATENNIAARGYLDQAKRQLLEALEVIRHEQSHR
jgi:hypothetical protein